MKTASLSAIAALVLSLTAGAAGAADSSSTNATVGSNVLGNIDVSQAGNTEDSRKQFLSTLNAEQTADLRNRCNEAQLKGETVDASGLDPISVALCKTLGGM